MINMRKKWEYLVVDSVLHYAADEGELLNKYGDEGWELCRVHDYNHDLDEVTYIFKREQ